MGADGLTVGALEDFSLTSLLNFTFNVVQIRTQKKGFWVCTKSLITFFPPPGVFRNLQFCLYFTNSMKRKPGRISTSVTCDIIKRYLFMQLQKACMNKEQNVKQIPQVRKGISTKEKDFATNVQIQWLVKTLCIDLYIYQELLKEEFNCHFSKYLNFFFNLYLKQSFAVFENWIQLQQSNKPL